MISVPFLDLAPMSAEVRDQVLAEWANIVDASAFVGGAVVEQFEQDWAAYCGRSIAIGVGNGTDALSLSLLAMGIGPGDEVIVPTNTFIATAEAVTRSGATPVFVDPDPASLLITGDAVRAAITTRTAAVMAVHLYGAPVDMTDLLSVTGPAGLAVIEDAAQAQGARHRGARTGSFGAAGCFSFYPGKNLGAFGDAGAIVTDDVALAGKIRSLANHGRSQISRYHHDLDGMNSRLDALQAVVLSAKLPLLDAWNAARRSHAARYRELLADAPVKFTELPDGTESVVHLEVVQVDHRDDVQKRLAELDVHAGVHYPIPCHQHPPFQTYTRGSLPVAEDSAPRLLSLPMFPHLSEDQIETASAALAAVLTDLGGSR